MYIKIIKKRKNLKYSSCRFPDHASGEYFLKEKKNVIALFHNQ